MKKNKSTAVVFPRQLNFIKNSKKVSSISNFKEGSLIDMINFFKLSFFHIMYAMIKIRRDWKLKQQHSSKSVSKVCEGTLELIRKPVHKELIKATRKQTP